MVINQFYNLPDNLKTLPNHVNGAVIQELFADIRDFY